MFRLLKTGEYNTKTGGKNGGNLKTLQCWMIWDAIISCLNMLASGHATSSTCELKQAKLESSMMNSVKVIKQNNTKPIMNYPRQFTIQHQQNMVTSNFPDFFYCKTNAKRLGSFQLGRLMENDHAFHIPISNVTQDFGPMSCTEAGNRSRILQALNEPNNTYIYI